jgi:hypothetical protein
MKEPSELDEANMTRSRIGFLLITASITVLFVLVLLLAFGAIQ